MKYIVFYLILFSLQFSQESIVIDSIYIEGNIETDLDVITREINFKTGEKITREHISFVQRRIESMNIFNSVRYHLYNRNGYQILVFHLSEKLNLFGKPIVDFDNNDNSKFSYGVELYHTNFRGRNEFISLRGQFGFRPGFRIRYRNPWVFGNTHLKYSLYLQSFSVESSKDLTKKVPEIVIGGNFGKGFGLFYSIYFGLTYQFRDFSYLKELANTSDEKETHVVYSLGHKFNNIDFDKFPTKGWDFSHSIYYGNMLNYSEFDYYGMSINISNYNQIFKNVILAMNFNSTNQGGKPTLYNQVSLGQNGLIRGNDSFSRAYSFNRTIIRNEIRYKLIDDYFISLPIPYFEKYTQEMRTSLYSYLFHDVGLLYDEISDIRNPQLTKHGYGYGFSILFPYVYRMSFEFGFDGNGQQKFSFLLNAFF